MLVPVACGHCIMIITMRYQKNVANCVFGFWIMTQAKNTFVFRTLITDYRVINGSETKTTHWLERRFFLVFLFFMHFGYTLHLIFMCFLLNFWENDVCGPFGPFQSKPIIYLVFRSFLFCFDDFNSLFSLLQFNFFRTL